MVSHHNYKNDNEATCRPRFDNLKEKTLYWKEMAEEYIQKLQSAREDFDEYQNNSRELEAALESQLEQYEERITNLISSKCKLEVENDKLMEKLEATVKQTFLHITELHDENLHMKDVTDEMSGYIKELEKSNDDLEKDKVSTRTLLEELQVHLRNSTEKNILLEKELADQDQEMIRFQQMKDECRDLKGALAISSRERMSLKESTLKLEEAYVTTPTHAGLTDNEKLKPCSDILTDKPNEVGEYNMITSFICKLTSRKDYTPPHKSPTLVNTLTDARRTPNNDIKSKLATYKSSMQAYSQKSSTKSLSEVFKTMLLPPGINDEYIKMVNTFSKCERTSYCVNLPNV